MKFTKVSADAFEKFQLNAGMVLKTFNTSSPAAPADSDIVCATTGGINTSCVAQYDDFGEDVDNVPANTKELKHLKSWDCKMSFTALDATPEVIKMSLGAADVSGIKIAPRRDLKLEDFTEAIWWVGDRNDGGVVAVKLINALSTGGMNLTTTKDAKGNIAVELTGHISLSNQDEVPMEFYVVEG